MGQKGPKLNNPDRGESKRHEWVRCEGILSAKRPYLIYFPYFFNFLLTLIYDFRILMMKFLIQICEDRYDC